ncbi:SDR family oxidoreductase [Pseudonocardia sp. HH130629-09]|uniref:SDR family oxidoreductase n=1 Tax=Pseudonocardia sp. HH130629-09 TaxID=1641402 RepID=UPI0009E7F0B0|nr:SDR family oxidoreductase [Pseudonocardia sp. HH130629-09]
MTGSGTRDLGGESIFERTDLFYWGPAPSLSTSTPPACRRQPLPTTGKGSLTAVAELTPLGRLGSPQDIAGVVLFLVGPEGRWLTGQNLRAAGGLA